MTNEELAIKTKNGNNGLMTELWEQNKGFFHLKSRRLFLKYRDRCTSCGVELDDIVQICFFALCDAVKAFQADGQYKLLTYTKYPLLNHFNALMGLRTSKRDPLDHAASLNEAAGGEDDKTERIDLLEDPSSEEPFEAVIDDIFQYELHNALETSISKLPDNRAAAVRGRYFENKSQGDIAAEMGVTQSYIHQLEFEAMRKLRQDRSLQSFHDEIISNYAYKNTGLQSFKTSFISGVERAVITVEELIERRQSLNAN